jgi:hypothetical protein
MTQRKGCYENQKTFPVAPAVKATKGNQKQDVVVSQGVGNVPHARFKPNGEVFQAIRFKGTAKIRVLGMLSAVGGVPNSQKLLKAPEILHGTLHNKIPFIPL